MSARFPPLAPTQSHAIAESCHPLAHRNQAATAVAPKLDWRSLWAEFLRSRDERQYFIFDGQDFPSRPGLSGLHFMAKGYTREELKAMVAAWVFPAGIKYLAVEIEGAFLIRRSALLGTVESFEELIPVLLGRPENGWRVPAEALARFELVNKQEYLPPPEIEASHHLLAQAFASLGMSQAEFTRSYTCTTGDIISPEAMGRLFKPDQTPPAFARLLGLATFLRLDLNHLIEAFNAQSLSALSDYARGPYYPVYAETRDDVRKIRKFSSEDPRQESLGWLVFSARKNPSNYKSIYGGKIHRSLIDQIENNLKAPTIETLLLLSESLNIPVETLLRISNRTMYGSGPIARRFLGDEVVDAIADEFHGQSINDLIEKLLPGQAIYLQGKSEDLPKLLAYARRPGTLGQLFFALRKNDPEHASLADLTKRLGITDRYWPELEWNKTEFARHQLGRWLPLLDAFGVPHALLLAFFRDQGVDEASPLYLFSKALQGRDVAEIFGANYDDPVLSEIINQLKPNLSAKAIKRIKEDLPELDGARFYRALHPEIKEYFPSSRGDDPHLNISQPLFDYAITEFNLGRLLFTFRMDQELTRTDLARLMKVTDAAIVSYETVTTNFRTSEYFEIIAEIIALERLAVWLRQNETYPHRFVRPDSALLERTDVSSRFNREKQWAMRAVYLHFRPEILALFPIRGKMTGLTDNKKAIQQAIARTQERGLGLPISRNFSQIISKHFGIKYPQAPLPVSLDDFAQALHRLTAGAISMTRAVKFFQPYKNLTIEEILSIKKYFPEIFAQDWYEHFNHAALTYFLGFDESGKIDYHLPEGWTWANLKRPDLIRALIDEQIISLYGSRPSAAQATGVASLAGMSNLRRLLDITGPTQDVTIERLAKHLQLDRRLLFLYFHRQELEKIWAADGKPLPEPPRPNSPRTTELSRLPTAKYLARKNVRERRVPLKIERAPNSFRAPPVGRGTCLASSSLEVPLPSGGVRGGGLQRGSVFRGAHKTGLLRHAGRNSLMARARLLKR